MRSLRIRLFSLWLLSLAASLVVAFLLLHLYQQTAQARVSRAEAVVARACDLVRDQYSFFVAGWSGPRPDLANPGLRANLANVVGLALTDQDGIEGGVWQTKAGPLAYAYPTYQGSGPKTDLPAAEKAQIEAVNLQAARSQQPADHETRSRAQTLLLHACPLAGPIPDLTAWTMARVDAAPGLRPLLLGLAVLFGLLLAMALWLGRTVLVWGRHIRGIETALAETGPRGMPAISLTGEQEFDRIIGALNDAGRRLLVAQREAEAMAQRVARAERLAGLGRVAAGVAHEIRNPLAAARLQGENGLAGDDARRTQAIGDMLRQIDRLDGLVGELLAMTQRVAPQPVETHLAPFLSECIARHEGLAADRRIVVRLRDVAGTAMLDPAMIRRVLDNLLTNAIRHAPTAGAVTLICEQQADKLTITVEDTGTGITTDLTDQLFEPFVTGRPDGTGLGLAIARELMDAHGGRLTLRRAGGERPGQGAAFALELPREPPCPRS